MKKKYLIPILCLPLLYWVVVYLWASSYYHDASFHYRTAALYYDCGDINEWKEQNKLGNIKAKKGNEVLLYIDTSFRPAAMDTAK